MTQTIDTLLDASGRVVLDSRLAETMRRVVLNDAGEVMSAGIYVAVGREAAAETHGDVPGHPFHGNQHEKVLGGSAANDPATAGNAGGAALTALKDSFDTRDIDEAARKRAGKPIADMTQSEIESFANDEHSRGYDFEEGNNVLYPVRMLSDVDLVRYVGDGQDHHTGHGVPSIGKSRRPGIKDSPGPFGFAFVAGSEEDRDAQKYGTYGNVRLTFRVPHALEAIHFASAQREVIYDVRDVGSTETHGDKVGHIFHGNQWVGGMGSSPLGWALGDMSEDDSAAVTEKAKAYIAKAKTMHKVSVLMEERGYPGISLSSAAVAEAQIHASILVMPKSVRDMMEHDGWKVSVPLRGDGPGNLGYTDFDLKQVAMSPDGIFGSKYTSGATGMGFSGVGPPLVGQPMLQHELGHVEMIAATKYALAASAIGDKETANEIGAAVKSLAKAISDGHIAGHRAFSGYAGKFSETPNAWSNLGGALATVDSSGKIDKQIAIPDFIHETYAEIRSAVEGQGILAKPEPRSGGASAASRTYRAHIAAYAKIRKALGNASKKSKKLLAVKFYDDILFPSHSNILGRDMP